MATKGLFMSASVTPVALSKARWGARWIPALTLSDRTLSSKDSDIKKAAHWDGRPMVVLFKLICSFNACGCPFNGRRVLNENQKNNDKRNNI